MRCTLFTLFVGLFAAAQQAFSADDLILEPSSIKKETRVRFPGAIEDIEVGGNGRLLICHVAAIQQLAVFDVCTGKIRGYVPLPANEVSIAAGASKLFIGWKDDRSIQRWNLADLKKELQTAAPVGGIGDMAMGATSKAPLFLLAEREAKKSWVIDPRRMKAAPMTWEGWRGGAWGPVNVEVSFDGKTVIAHGGGYAGIEVATIGTNKVTTSATGSYVRDDATVAGNGALVFADTKIIRRDLASEVEAIEGTAFPALSSHYSCSLFIRKKKPVVTVFSSGDPRRLLTIHNLSELAGKSKLPLYKRAMLIPKAGLLVTVGKGSDNLILRPIDLKQKMKDEGLDFLFVESTPVTDVRRGTKYRYELAVSSSAGGEKMVLQSGPDGMRLSSKGVVTWAVPSKPKEASFPVVIAVTDDSEQEIFHTFRIVVE